MFRFESLSFYNGIETRHDCLNSTGFASTFLHRIYQMAYPYFSHEM